MDWLDDEKGKIRIFLILSLPVLQRLNVMLLIHVLAALPQLLVMYDIDIRTFLAEFLHPPRVVLQSLDDEFLIDLLLIAEGKEGDLLIGEEVLDVSVCFFPLLLAIGFEEYSFF
jgi:hypothetical protein